MKNKLKNIVLVVLSTFALNSCGDSSDSYTEKSINIMEQAVSAANDDDVDKFKSASEELAKLAADMMKDGKGNEESLSDEQKEKLAKVTKEYTEAAAKMAPKLMPQMK